LTTDPPTSWQAWARNYSERLLNSFRGSSQFQHSVTIGTSRERQVIDFLKLLPARVSVEKEVIVVDHEGTEAPQLDGVILDRSNLPLLYADGPVNEQGTITVAMIESVIACVETKSRLEESSIHDAFNKTRRLRSMKVLGGTANRPLFTVFAYLCDNVHLAYFDYARSFWRDRATAPTPICVLNQAVFAAARRFGDEMRLTDDSGPDTFPVLLETGSDSLLAYFYILFKAASTQAPWDAVAQAYSSSFFAQLACIHFDDDFLNRIVSDPSIALQARSAFSGHPAEQFETLYGNSRRSAGLS